jgi:hypothetical protein
MVALRVALVIAWIVAQVVGVIVAAVATRDGFSSPLLAVPAWILLLALPPVFGVGGLWLAVKAGDRWGMRAEAIALSVPIVLLVGMTAVTLRSLA